MLVYHDLLGMLSHPHHAKVTPKFCKQYANVGEIIQSAITRYRDDVSARTFPSAAFSPYRIPAHEVDALASALSARGMGEVAEAVQLAAAAEAIATATGAMSLAAAGQNVAAAESAAATLVSAAEGKL